MIFKENKFKAFMYKCSGGAYMPYQTKKYKILTIISFIMFILLIPSLGSIATVLLAVSAICFLRMLKYAKIHLRYDDQLEITDDMIILSHYAGRGRKKEKYTMSIKRSQLEGIEYFKQYNQIAFLGIADYGTVKLYGMFVGNIFTVNPLPYLEENIMKVSVVKKGSFGDKWRKD